MCFQAPFDWPDLPRDTAKFSQVQEGSKLSSPRCLQLTSWAQKTIKGQVAQFAREASCQTGGWLHWQRTCMQGFEAAWCLRREKSYVHWVWSGTWYNLICWTQIHHGPNPTPLKPAKTLFALFQIHWIQPRSNGPESVGILRSAAPWLTQKLHDLF